MALHTSTLPNTHYLRQSQIIPTILPVSHSTLWRWVKSDRFPRPVKLSENITVWCTEDVRLWINKRESVH